MHPQQRLAAALIGLGLIALLANLSHGALWLGAGVLAALCLSIYSKSKQYALLISGCLLAGVSAGMLFENVWHWPGATLLMLGFAFIAVDRIETRSNRWPRYPGAILMSLGVLTYLGQTAVLDSWWFAVALIFAGVTLLNRASEPKASGSGGWVHVAPRGASQEQEPS